MNKAEIHQLTSPPVPDRPVVSPPPSFDRRVMQNYLTDCQSRRFVSANLPSPIQIPNGFQPDPHRDDLMGSISPDSDLDNLIEMDLPSMEPGWMSPGIPTMQQPTNQLDYDDVNVGILIDIGDNSQPPTTTRPQETTRPIAAESTRTPNVVQTVSGDYSQPSTTTRTIAAESTRTNTRTPEVVPIPSVKPTQIFKPTPQPRETKPSASATNGSAPPQVVMTGRDVRTANLPPHVAKFLAAKSKLSESGQLCPLVPLELYGDGRIDMGSSPSSASLPYRFSYVLRDDDSPTANNRQLVSNSSGPSSSVSRRNSNEDHSRFVKIGRLPTTAVQNVEDLKRVLSTFMWFEGILTVELISPVVPEDRGFYSARVGFQTHVDAQWAVVDLNNKKSLFKGQMYPLTASFL